MEPNGSYFTIFDLYTSDDVAKILASVPDDHWKQGQARTAELTGTVKQNEEAQSGGSKIVAALCRAHAKKLAGNPDIKREHLVKGISPPKFNRYSGGGTYKRHTDAPTMAGMRTDLACTTFLSDPESYDGGELNVEDRHGAVHSVKARVGQVVVYPCGQPHWVSPVTNGERVALVCWIQSYVRDEHQRGILSSMIRSLQKIEPLSHDDDLMREVWTELGGAHADLFRMWME